MYCAGWFEKNGKKKHSNTQKNAQICPKMLKNAQKDLKWFFIPENYPIWPEITFILSVPPVLKTAFQKTTCIMIISMITIV